MRGVVPPPRRTEHNPPPLAPSFLVMAPTLPEARGAVGAIGMLGCPIQLLLDPDYLQKAKGQQRWNNARIPRVDISSSIHPLIPINNEIQRVGHQSENERKEETFFGNNRCRAQTSKLQKHTLGNLANMRGNKSFYQNKVQGIPVDLSFHEKHIMLNDFNASRVQGWESEC